MVIVIISVMIGLTVVNFSAGGADEAAEDEITRLQNLLRFAHEQSVIRAQEYGLRFYERGYRFLQYDDTRQEWLDIADDRLLHPRPLPEPLELSLYIEQVPVELLESMEDEPEDEADGEEKKQGSLDTVKEKKKIRPHIFLLSSGELTPTFELSIRIPGTDIDKQLQGLPEGVYERGKQAQ